MVAAPRHPPKLVPSNLNSYRPTGVSPFPYHVGAAAAPNWEDQATMIEPQAPLTRRFDEQRWMLDVAISTAGMECDQPRVAYTLAPCGTEAAQDFAHDTLTDDVAILAVRRI